MFDLNAVQTALRDQSLDGWLMYDFRGSNPLARRVLKFPPGGHHTRRWFYFVPATGEPMKLVHRIENGALDHLPGKKEIYLKRQELGRASQLRRSPVPRQGKTSRLLFWLPLRSLRSLR